MSGFLNDPGVDKIPGDPCPSAEEMNTLRENIVLIGGMFLKNAYLRKKIFLFLAIKYLIFIENDAKYEKQLYNSKKFLQKDRKTQ